LTASGTSPWAVKASTLYNPAYARKYRAHDDEFESSEPCRRFADWLRQLCRTFSSPIDVLDLGCGTGRYFWALEGVREVVGIDASPAMLAEARNPYNASRISAHTVTLVEGDLFGHQFEPARFDLVYSIGVLAEHVPLDAEVVAHVSRWLKPNGRFAFTTVHPESPSVPRTFKRRLGESLAAIAPRTVEHRVRRLLLSGGLYADEARIEQLLADAFAIESLRRFESEAHQHCWCVARRSAP
jgi:SAM-dependent methyltransferase